MFSPCAADLLRVFGVVERERVYYAIKNATRHVLLGARMRDGLPTHTHKCEGCSRLKQLDFAQ